MIVPVATFESYTGVFGDPLAESYMTAAQEKVEKYLGYTLEAADYETTVKGRGRDYVRLAAAPINSVESVTVGGSNSIPTDSTQKAICTPRTVPFLPMNPPFRCPTMPDIPPKISQIS